MQRKHNHPGQCFPGSKDCQLEETSPPHRDFWAAQAAGNHIAGPDGTTIALPCVFRGPQIPRKDAPDPVRDWFECENGYGVVCPCQRCNSACAGYTIANVFRTFDAKNLFPDVPGTRFNASIVRWAGQNLIAFRNRSYASQIWVGRMCDNWKPIGEAWRLELKHTKCRDGQDDPRFFVFAGKLHVSFTGVERTGTGTRTNVMYCRLDDRHQVHAEFFCDYGRRNENEKNWGFFEHAGQLFASYSIAPHRVLAVDGERCRMECVTETRGTWPGGEMRGGASPLLIDHEWHSFFHSSQDVDGAREYWTGLALFQEAPPFRVTSLTSRPILRPDRPGSAAAGKRVIFTLGCHYHDCVSECLLLSSGIDDRFCDIRRVDRSDLAAFLRATIRPSDPDSVRDASFLQEARVSSCLDVDGWCSAEKAAWLGSAIKTVDARHVVELGVWHGRSLIAMALAMRRLSAERNQAGHVLGVDAYSEPLQVDGIADPRHTEWASRIDWRMQWPIALQNVERFVPGFASLMVCSTTIASRCVRGEIDLLHIDAGHGEESSCRDVREWLPLVRRGGLIVLDDTDWPTVQSALADLRRACEPVFDGRTWQAFRKI